MNQEPSLVKITRPSLENIYQRNNFFKILDKCREKPVIWLSAPPGAGKTTLISSFVESRKVECLWYQIDSSDGDPATFFHYMGLASEKTSKQKSPPLPHLTPEYMPGLQVFTRKYFLELFKRLEKNSILVFDNYQEAPVQSILHDLLSIGLGDVPKDFNIIIISRSVPPPVLSRMRLSNLMEVITYDELRLTAGEVKGIVSMKGMDKLPETDIRALLSRSEGWATGLMLMLENENPEDFPAASTESCGAEGVFDYFAGDFFQNLDNDTRKFLLKLSVLPVITSEMAAELTDNKSSERIINELVHRNYFIQSHPGVLTHYQLHPLFREFLYDRLTENSSTGDLIALEKKAAKLLADNAHIDDAVRILSKIEDWDSLATLICKEAPSMLEQGRHQTIIAWLDCLPQRVINEMPWLLFWKGNCYLPSDQAASRRSFEDAFEVFHASKDPAGVFLSWTGVVEATILAFDDLKPLDRWIGLFDSIVKEFPEFPSKDIEDRVSFWMFAAQAYRAPDHPDFQIWLDKVCTIIEETRNPNFFFQGNLFLVDYYLWVGDLKKADLISEMLVMESEKNDYPPLALISIKFSRSLSDWYHGKPNCIANALDALEIANASGINVFNYFLYGLVAVGSLTDGDLKAAEKYLNKAALVLDVNKRVCASYYHHIVACHRLLTRDLAGALEHEQLALHLAAQVGMLFPEPMCLTGMALIHYELGERKIAAEEITKAREMSVRTGSSLMIFVCDLFDAWFALDSSEKSLAITKLKKALALGNKKGFANFHMWNPKIITRLCVLALEEDIETDYAKKLIQERALFPVKAPLGLDNWPWRLKIHSIGAFKIIRDGEPLKHSRKAPKKPIELLKLLISLGGKGVPIEKISDTLWPDADGDAAHVAFTTTLKRLRQMLGIDDAIELSKGSLTINPRHCWVDVWAFNYLIDAAKDRSADKTDNVSADLLKKAIDIYDKGFIITPDEESWTVLFSESIRSKFIRAVTMLGSYLEEAGEFEKAVECYRKGIEVDVLSEQLYQRLMTCLHKQGHTTEALAVYKRLGEVCQKALGVDPSSETKRIYEKLFDS